MQQPVGAGALTIRGGFFILLGGLVFLLVGAILAVLGHGSVFFLVGILVGLLTIVVGCLMIAVPSLHAPWGGVTLLFAVVSLFVTLGGFFLGFLNALIGGTLALTGRPPGECVITVEAHPVPPPPSG